MTEYEINKAVAEELGLTHEITRYGVVTRECNKEQWREFNPCNNAQQAWDIMLDNHICVLNVGDNHVAFNVKGKSVDRHKLDEKPLVAAMLLFLEI